VSWLLYDSHVTPAVPLDHGLATSLAGLWTWIEGSCPTLEKKIQHLIKISNKMQPSDQA